jgi:hypothetical protein
VGVVGVVVVVVVVVVVGLLASTKCRPNSTVIRFLDTVIIYKLAETLHLSQQYEIYGSRIARHSDNYTVGL